MQVAEEPELIQAALYDLLERDYPGIPKTDLVFLSSGETYDGPFTDAPLSWLSVLNKPHSRFYPESESQRVTGEPWNMFHREKFQDGVWVFFENPVWNNKDLVTLSGGFDVHGESRGILYTLKRHEAMFAAVV
jgi:hypothetical protein